MNGETLTVIMSANGQPATKRWSIHKNGRLRGKLKKSGEPKIANWHAAKVCVASIFDLHDALSSLEGETRMCVIYGEPNPENTVADSLAGLRSLVGSPYVLKRKKQGAEAAFFEVPRRFLVLDLDKIRLPAGSDLIADPEDIIEYIIGLLPTECHDATYHWQLTASTGLKEGDVPGKLTEDTVSVRLWFWLDRPIDGADLRRWVKWANREYAHLHGDGRLIDLTILKNCVQPIFTAAPLFLDNLKDPLARRSGLRRGLVDEVSLELPGVEVASISAPSAWSDLTELQGQPIGDLETLCGIMGDGEGRDGFYRPIARYVGTQVRRQGQTMEPEALKTEVRLALNQAPKREDREADLERYTSDGYLDRMIEDFQRNDAGANAQGFESGSAYLEIAGVNVLSQMGRRQRPLGMSMTARLKAGIAPTFPNAPISKEVGTARLRQQTKEFWELAAQRALLMNQLKAALHRARIGALQEAGFSISEDASLFEVRAVRNDIEGPEEKKRVLAATRSRMKEARERLLGDQGVGSLDDLSPLRHVIAAAAGSGKTSVVVREMVMALKRHPEALGLRIDFFLPTVALAEELRDRIFSEIERAFGKRDPGMMDFAPRPSVRVMYGRGQPIPDTDDPWCRRAELAEKVAKAGRSVQSTLCRSIDVEGVERFCPHYDECGLFHYRSQYADRKTQIRIYTHQHLALPRTEQLSVGDIIIIDENPFEALVRDQIEIDPGEIASLAESGLPEDREPHQAMDTIHALKQLADALQAPLPKRALLEAGVRRERLQVAYKILGEAAKLSLSAHADSSDAHIEELLKAGKQRAIFSRVKALIGALLREWDLERDLLHGVEFRAAEVIEESDGEGPSQKKERAVVHGMKRLNLGAHGALKPLVLLDADASPEIYEPIFGTDLSWTRIELERNAHVTQVFHSTFSDAYLVPRQDDSEAELKAKRRSNLRWNIAHKREQHGSLLVVSTLKVRCLLTGEKPGSKLPQSIEIDGVTYTHYHRVKGVDRWKDYQAVMVIGRPQLPVRELEALGRALFATHPDPIEFVQQSTMPNAERGYSLRAKHLVGVEVQTHPDPRIQAVQELLRERRVVQAIDRLRLVHHDGQPKKVYVVGKTPLWIVVDELFPPFWPKLARCIAYARREGWAVFPLAAGPLCRLFPAIFDGEGGAKEALKGFELFWGGTLLEIFIGLPPQKTFEFKTAGKQSRHASKGIVLDPSRNPQQLRSELTDLLGEELSYFEVEDVKMPRAETQEPATTTAEQMGLENSPRVQVAVPSDMFRVGGRLMIRDGNETMYPMRPRTPRMVELCGRLVMDFSECAGMPTALCPLSSPEDIIRLRGELRSIDREQRIEVS